VQAAERVAGGADESIFQPEWSPDGTLYFVSDRSGWWNLHRAVAEGVEAVCPMDAEFGEPQWLFGKTLYGFVSATQMICVYISDAVSHLARLNVETRELIGIPTPYTDIIDLQVGDGLAVFIGGAPTIAQEVVAMELASGARTVLARSAGQIPDAAFLSVPQTIRHTTQSDMNADIEIQGFHYPPCNPNFTAPEGTLPPLMVISHGGPTSMTTTALRLAVQYWTSRGFAVLDVNYRGSSGFGRAYRDALRERWGEADVEDCVAGSRHLAAAGLVDPKRMVIRGASAGGYTTLCAIAFHKVFAAGASRYGVADLTALLRDTHKFESRYLYSLIGRYPEQRERYEQRSPLLHAEQIGTPVIFFQGLDDPAVPAEQSETMAQALRARGIPVAYIAFPGEGHGFRKAENIQRSLEAELYFYSQVLGFAPAEEIDPVQIDNM
jgi:dipeptidyl aminopeptidase/acylaminoacyl peptidase